MSINNTKDHENHQSQEEQQINDGSSNDGEHKKEFKAKRFSWSRFLLSNLFFFVLYSIVIGIDFAYKDPLFDKNIETVPDIQRKHSFMDYFMEIIALSGEAGGIIFICLIAISIIPYIDGLFFILVLWATAYTNELLKMLHHDPRPFQVDGEVEALTCSKSYGNPSGHCMAYATVYPMLFYLLFYSKHFRRQFKPGCYWASYFIVGTLIFLVITLGTFGRIYLGVHSYDQVLYGWLFGTVMLWHILLVLKEPYDLLMLKFMTQRCTKRQWIVGSIVACLIISAMLIISLIAYAINRSTHDDSPSWFINIALKWNVSSINKDATFAKAGLSGLFLASGTVSGVLGSILYSYFSKFPINEQSFNKWWKVFARIGINIVIPIPVLLLMLIPTSAPYVILLIFSDFIVGFGLGFLTFSVSKYANKCINSS